MPRTQFKSALKNFLRAVAFILMAPTLFAAEKLKNAVGRLDDYRVKDEWFQWKNIAKKFGYLFFGLGLVLLALIVYAMVSRLAH